MGIGETGIGETGIGETGIGETVIGEPGIGETGGHQNHKAENIAQTVLHKYQLDNTATTK